MGRMLEAFQALFKGKPYKHRAPNQGDQLATELYEDLYDLNRSVKFIADVDKVRRGISVANVRAGVSARRGDGTLGQLIPGQPSSKIPGYNIRRGPVATLDVGIEVKILNKAMTKQVNDRISGLQKQADYFVKGRDGRNRGTPITVAVVGINYAAYTVGYEGDRVYKTDGRQNPHPIQEAPAIEERLRRELMPSYDETIFLQYLATNEYPFSFSWLNEATTRREYGAVLVRISAEYERRF